MAEYPGAIALVRRIFATDRNAGESAGPSGQDTDMWQDKMVRSFMAAAVFIIGLVTALVMGLPRAFSEKEETRVIAMILVLTGLIFCYLVNSHSTSPGICQVSH